MRHVVVDRGGHQDLLTGRHQLGQPLSAPRSTG
jgi:hypothetical protein